MQIRLEASDLPGASCGPSPERPEGHHRIRVGVQRKGKPDEILGLTPGDAPSATWTLECTAIRKEGGVDVRGPYIQGPPGGRFIYLSWGTEEEDNPFRMFRRAKVLLNDVPPELLKAAADGGVLVGRLGLTDPKGNPTCAGVRPPLIAWTVGR